MMMVWTCRTPRGDTSEMFGRLWCDEDASSSPYILCNSFTLNPLIADADDDGDDDDCVLVMC